MRATMHGVNYFGPAGVLEYGGSFVKGVSEIDEIMANIES